MTNPFETYGDRAMNGAQKNRMRREERREAKLRPPSALEIKQAEDAILAKLYRNYRRALKQEIIAAHGERFKKLESLLRGLRWQDAEMIVDHVFQTRWLMEQDEGTKLAVLGYIDESFCRSRVRDGRSPIDDALPGEPMTPFLKVRHLLFGY